MSTLPHPDDPLVVDLVTRHEADPERRWTEADVVALGYDPSTVRRAFRRQFGVTFLRYSRQARVGRGFQHLARTHRVIDAQLTAGFESASGFRDAFARLLGVAPQDLVRTASPLRADWIETPLGPMVAVAGAAQLHLLEFADRPALPRELQRLATSGGGAPAIGTHAPIEQVREELTAYFAGRGARFDTPFAMAGTPFTRTVWRALREIPAGETRSYLDIARAIGRPTATRAVARANGANQIAIVIPCHRVIGADGSLTGYGGGLWRKQRLIAVEAAYGNGTVELDLGV
jgi:AraC family transcriptional regulator of adaptative response/methylated-DNA-[protein]-cysteine methyltransferase